jgi:hypothetical protein
MCYETAASSNELNILAIEESQHRCPENTEVISA